MRRSLKQHGQYVAARLDELRKLQATGQDVTAAGRELAAYHHRETQSFQHERLIHLLVTFFFGALLVAALTGLVMLGLGDADTPATSSMFMVLSGGCLVVLVLEVFYVNHYYHLENGVQKL
ncbi:MAG: hypothetical protein LBH68_05455, partial [Bifidobacteriaceae bacterium]|nr:hypothetical protein [Bifidobacteriaceae bacterium]